MDTDKFAPRDYWRLSKTINPVPFAFGFETSASLSICIPPPFFVHGATLPNLERASQLLNDLPALWQHPGVSDGQRQDFAREVFRQILLDGRAIIAVEPNPQNASLFAYNVWRQGEVNGVGARGLEQTPLTSRVRSGVIVLGVSEWVKRLANAAYP